MSPLKRQKKMNNAANSNEQLALLRKEIDKIDDNLWNLFHKRMEICKQVGAIKHAEGLDVLQPERRDEMWKNRLAWAKEIGLSEEATLLFFESIHEASIKEQNNIKK